MTDLEMTKLCAEAMEYPVYSKQGDQAWDVSYAVSDPHRFIYAPLTNDAQALALVKRFAIALSKYMNGWDVSIPEKPELCDQSDVSGSDILYAPHARSSSLNRAIVECVAKMQASK